MERPIKDMFGHELKEGDSICFTLSMRRDEKPIVKARVAALVYGKNCDDCGRYNDWIVIDCYVETSTVEWARREGKLIQKVSPDRVVKCH